MRQEISNAVEIANSYRNSREGEIPVLVVAHTADGVQKVYTGIFRTHKNHIVDDQKMFCSVMRMAFAIHNVFSYEFLVKPEFNYEAAQMTKNVLAVVAVNDSGKTVEWFEIEDDGLTPYFSEMPVEGMFTQLLPTAAEREYPYNAKTINGINSYLDACTFEIPEPVVVDDAIEQNAFADMIAAFS